MTRRAAPLRFQRVSAVEGDGSGPLLRCIALDVAYGRNQILFGVHLDVDAGEIVALLGTNGAGKSTLMRAISGLTPPRDGRVVFGGEEVTGSSPVRMAALGLSHMPGGRGIFPDLTVGENLRMASWTLRGDAKQARRAIDRTLEIFPMLAERQAERAGLLSGGQQQMLALAQAFIPGPRLLMVDELSLGLAPVIVSELLEVVHRLRDAGIAVLLVEQSAELALRVADRVVFLEKGEVRFSGSAAELVGRHDLVRSIFLAGAMEDDPGAPGAATTGADSGDDPDDTGDDPDDTGDDPDDTGDGSDRTFRRFEFLLTGPGGDAPPRPSLRAGGLRKAFGGLQAVDGVSLDVGGGEIVGLMGPNGAGKTTVLDLLSGFVIPDHGTVHLGDHDLSTLAPDARARLGLGRSFQDARLFPGLTVFETLAVSCDRWVTSRDPLAAALRLPASTVSEAQVADRVERILRVLRLGVFRHRFSTELSTGTRRLVEFGCLLAQEPDVLLLDEPSAGLARAEAEALGPVLRRIRDAMGAALVLVEHDIALLRAACDRIVALDAGRILAQGPPGRVLEDPAVVAAYIGVSPETQATTTAVSPIRS